MSGKTVSGSRLYGSVFLSHAHENKDAAEALRVDLERRNVSVWLDNHQLTVGDELTKTIVGAIANADYFVVLLSEHAITSPWVKKEIDFALSLETSSGKSRIIPLRIGRLPKAGILVDRVHLTMDDPQARKQNLPALLNRVRILDLEAAEEIDWAAIVRVMEETFRPIQTLFHQGRSDDAFKTTLYRACLESTIPKDDLALAFEAFANVHCQSLPHGQPARDFGILYSCASAVGEIYRDHGHGLSRIHRLLQMKHFTSEQSAEIAAEFTRSLGPAKLDDVVELFSSYFHNPTSFHSFVHHNIDQLEDALENIVDHLLSPDVGPGQYRLDTFMLLLAKHPRLASLEECVIGWVRDDRFVFYDREGCEVSDILFCCLFREWPNWNERYSAIAQALLNQIRYYLKSKNKLNFAKGFMLLTGAVEANYDEPCGFYSTVISECVERVYRETIPDAFGQAFYSLAKGLQVRGRQSGGNTYADIDRIDKENIYAGVAMAKSLLKEGDLW